MTTASVDLVGMLEDISEVRAIAVQYDDTGAEVAP